MVTAHLWILCLTIVSLFYYFVLGSGLEFASRVFWILASYPSAFFGNLDFRMYFHIY